MRLDINTVALFVQNDSADILTKLSENELIVLMNEFKDVSQRYHMEPINSLSLDSLTTELSLIVQKIRAKRRLSNRVLLDMDVYEGLRIQILKASNLNMPPEMEGKVYHLRRHTHAPFLPAIVDENMEEWVLTQFELIESNVIFSKDQKVISVNTVKQLIEAV